MVDDVEVFAIPDEEPIQARDNLIMPPLKTVESTYTDTGAADKAFFAASDSNNPVEDFLSAKQDLMEKGVSTVVTDAEERAKHETGENSAQAVQELLIDNTISDELKKSVLRTHAAGGDVSKSLRNRFIERTVVEDTGSTLADATAQDNKADDVENIKTKVLVGERADDQETWTGELITFAQASGSIASNIASSAFGGLAGVYSMIADRDVAKAAKFVETTSALIQQYGYNPKGDDVAKVQEAIMNDLHKLAIPAEWIADKALELTGSPGAATAALILLDPVNLLPVAASAKMLKFRKGSGAGVFGKTNPKAAGDLYAGAIYDDTGELAKAIGSDKGTIIQETILPDLVDTGLLKENPDIANVIKIVDNKAEYSFHLHKYDPNLTDVAERQADLDLVLDVLKQTGSPYYQQANSVVTSPGINVYEGKAVYGRNATGNYVSREGAEMAAGKLQEKVDTLPQKLRGTVEIVERGNGEFVIEHSWRKEYEPLDTIAFGPNAVNSTFAGLDINGLKHTPFGKWLFPTGVFPQKYESAKGRSVDRAAKQANDIQRDIRDNITNSKHKRELNGLVEEGEALGKEYYSPQEITEKYPHLKASEVQDLFASHVMWRRVAHYEHRILNNMKRNEMLNKDMKTVYDGSGEQVVNVSPLVQTKEITSGIIREIHDLDGGHTIPAGTLEKLEDGTTIMADGRQVVRLHEPVTGTDGGRLNYAVIGKKHNIGALTAQVLPRITGWSPRRHLNHFYIDRVPTHMRIDGNDITNKETLREHRTSLSGAKTRFEAEEIARNLQAKHPNDEVVVRQDRIEGQEAILNDYESNTALYAQSRKRGEGLENTRIEDRLKTLMDTATSLTRQNNLATWEQATQLSFIKSYGSKSADNILTNDKFPRSTADITKRELPTAKEKANYDSAVALIENYTRFKEYSYSADRLWGWMNHKIADVVEKINIPGNLMRDLATINNPVVSFPKKLGSFLYINTNVLRQWFIQPQQMAELVAIHPSTARQTFSDMTRMSMHLVGSIEGAGTMGKLAKWSSEHMNIKAISTPESEIRMNVQAIRDSGIIDSVDTNVLVHGVFHDTNKLVTGVGEKVRGASVYPFSTVSKLGRGLGYDPAEILNKMGIWLQMKQKYITQNPQKKWNSPAGREWIANAVHLYSGNMNKAGNLPYQAGMLSPFFQFSAIGHKQFMNFMQNTATPLSGAERARLGAVRFAMFGAKYGLPGGGLIYMYIDKYGDEETAKKADLIKHGIADILVNKALRTFMDEDGEYTDLGVSRSISPLGESGVPYFDQAFQTIAMLDDDSATNPRFPLFGVATNLLKVHKQWESIWYGKDYSTKEKLEYAALTAMSAASGFNNYFKAMIVLGSGEKLNRIGNPIGLKFTTAEAMALFIGVQSNKEEWAYEQMRRFRDDTENRKQIAKDIYQYTTQIENMINPDGTASDKMEAVGNALDIAVNGEGFTAAAKQDVLTQVLRLSARDGNLKTNIIKNWVMSGKMLSDNEKSKMLDILRRDKSPEIQELVTAIEEDNL